MRFLVEEWTNKRSVKLRIGLYLPFSRNSHLAFGNSLKFVVQNYNVFHTMCFIV